MRPDVRHIGIIDARPAPVRRKKRLSFTILDSFGKGPLNLEMPAEGRLTSGDRRVSELPAGISVSSCGCVAFPQETCPVVGVQPVTEQTCCFVPVRSVGVYHTTFGKAVRLERTGTDYLSAHGHGSGCRCRPSAARNPPPIPARPARSCSQRDATCERAFFRAICLFSRATRLY